MSYGNHQSYQGAQTPGHYQQPSGGGLALKTCLIVGGIVGGLGLVVVIACAGLFYLFAARVDDELSAQDDSETTAGAVAEPADLDEAIRYLYTDDAESHLAAAQWLRDQPLDRSFQSRVNKGLMSALAESDSRSHRAALDALKTWGEPSSAGELAASLRPGDNLNREKLELLGRWGRAIGTEDIAELLKSSTDAENAYQALQSIGVGSAPAVAEYLAASGRAREYAQLLFQEWGIDPNDALIELYTTRLLSDDSSDRSNAAKRLAAVDFEPAYQDEVVRAVNQAFTADLGDKSELMNVLIKWGNESCLSIVHQAIRGNSWERSEAIQVAINIRSPDSIPVIAELLDEFGGDGNEAVNALIAFGDEAIEPTLEYLNHEDDSTHDRARRVIRSLDVSDDRVVDQCIEDMRSGEEGRATAACEFMADVTVNPDKRSDVATAMAVAMEDVNVFAKREIAGTFCKWATEDEIDLLLDMAAEGDDEVWLPAFKKLLQFNDVEAMTLLTAALLEDFFKQDEALAAMQQADPPVEELAIVMLQHNDPDVCFEMCRLLSVIGGESALRPLDDLEKRAVRGEEIELRRAVDSARSEIRARVAAQRQNNDGDDDGGDDDGSDDDGDG